MRSSFIAVLALVIAIIITCTASIVPVSASSDHYEGKKIEVGKKAVTALSFVPNKDTILAATVRTDSPLKSNIVVYDLDGNLLHDNEFDRELFCVSVSSDGTKAAAGSASHAGNSTLYVLSPINGKSITEIRVSHGGIYSLAYSHGGSLLAAGTGDGTLVLFNTTSYEVFREVNTGEKLFSVSFSPDGSRILMGSSTGKLIIHDINTGTEHSVIAHADRLYGVLWQDEDRVVSCGEEGLIKIFDQELTELGALSVHDDEVYCLAGHGSGKYMFSGGMDGRCIIWDMTNNSAAYELGSPNFRVYCCDSDPNGRQLCFGTSTSAIYVVDLDPDGDGSPLSEDAFPADPAASEDSDGDGSPDKWNTGRSQADSITNITHVDSFPLDPAASLDGDGDGVPDQWNEGQTKVDSVTNLTQLDAFPNDIAASLDGDGDGAPDRWNEGYGKSDSTTGLAMDVFPDDPNEWADGDWPMPDGTGDNGDWLPGINNYLFYLFDSILLAFIAVFAVAWYRKNAGKRTTVKGWRTEEHVRAEPSAVSIKKVARAPMIPVKGGVRNLLAGYSITHRIGAGAFATVYAAKGLEVERVAVKLPKTLDETLDSSVYEKFEAESAIWKKLEHRHIVGIHETGLEPIPYIVMELMEGGSLRQLLRERRPDVDESVRVMLGLLDALSYAHRMATVHRDIKPENILFTSDGVPKITDWGIGKLMISQSMTQSVGSKGTLAYSAPEQVSKKEFGEVDWSCDLFQAGIVFYEMLTGKNPFMAEDSAEVVTGIMYGEVAPPSTLNGEIPKVLDVIVMKALEKRKKDRWRSADVMYERLREMVK